jgi:two-component system, LytTR family, sensor kinase
MTDNHDDTRVASWSRIGAIWSAAALMDASQTILIMHAEGKHHFWAPLFVIEFVSWLPWALATPLIIGLARRYPIDRRIRVGQFAIHVAAFAGISVIAEVWSAWLQVLFNPWDNRRWPTFVDTWSTTLTFQALTFLIVYILIATVTYAADARSRIARQLTETALLNEELSRSQLAALRGQMEPHFMYNTLNSIAGLVRDSQKDAAVNMITGLSEFLRRASEDSHRAQVTLAEELEYLQRYLDIQKLRFGERLRIVMDVPPALHGAMVPNLLLQPLVENAIKHGIAERRAGGTVRVSAALTDELLHLGIFNDGPALPPDWQATHTGVGIGNLRTRLQILYGSGAELCLGSAESGGVEVLVTLPFREA